MKITELRSKSKTELQNLLKEHRQKERELRFRISSKQMKNVRELRRLKKEIARIMTSLNDNKLPEVKPVKQ